MASSDEEAIKVHAAGLGAEGASEFTSWRRVVAAGPHAARAVGAWVEESA